MFFHKTSWQKCIEERLDSAITEINSLKWQLWIMQNPPKLTLGQRIKNETVVDMRVIVHYEGYGGYNVAKRREYVLMDKSGKKRTVYEDDLTKEGLK